jgi:methyl-accepting chemotaxis protein
VSKSLNIRQKLAIVICLFMVPIILLGVLFVRQSMKDISFADAERNGLVYAHALSAVYFGAQKHATGLDADLASSTQVLSETGARFNASMGIDHRYA